MFSIVIEVEWTFTAILLHGQTNGNNILIIITTIRIIITIMIFGLDY